MKRLMAIGLVVVCLGARAGYELETKLWNALVPIYAQTGQDLESIYFNLEEYFVEEALLTNRNASGYEKLLKSKRLTLYTPYIDSVRGNMVSFAMALELYYLQEFSKDSQMVKKSRLYQLKKELSAAEISMDDFQKLFTEELNTNDLGHKLYQFMAQLVMINITPFNTGAAVMEAKAPQSEEVSADDILSITVNENDSLYCNGRPVSRNELMIIAEDHLSSRRSTAIIVILYDPDSDYEYYMSVFNGLKAVNEELRNEYALRVYKKNYNELDAASQAKVKALFPFVVSEVEKEDE